MTDDLNVNEPRAGLSQEIADMEPAERFRLMLSEGTDTPIMDAAMGWHDRRDLLSAIGNLERERDKLRAINAELLDALEKASRISEGWQNGEFDTEEDASEWAEKSFREIIKAVMPATAKAKGLL